MSNLRVHLIYFCHFAGKTARVDCREDNVIASYNIIKKRTHKSRLCDVSLKILEASYFIPSPFMWIDVHCIRLHDWKIVDGKHWR